MSGRLLPRRSKAPARLIHTAIAGAGLDVGALWRTYQLLGGTIAELEVDAYLHSALYLPPRHRDSLARAASQLVPGSRIPDSRDLRPEEHPPDA